MREFGDNIKQYAWFGYTIETLNVDRIRMHIFQAIRPSTLSEWRSKSNIHRGIEALTSAFGEIDDGIQVVPLSGGLDSRAILAGLLRTVPRERVRAATFGTPGTYDYEIGQLVARSAGIESVCFDLSKLEVTRAQLITALRSGASGAGVFDAHYNRLITDRFGHNVTYWSGFMGDRVAGASIALPPSRSWTEARGRFTSQHHSSRSLGKARFGVPPTQKLPESPWLDPSVLTFDEQFDFLIRQQHYIAKVLLPSGYRVRTPFLHDEWLNYIIAQPLEARIERTLYRQVLYGFASELFRLPTKTNLGFGLAATRAGEKLRRAMGIGAAAVRGRDFLAFRRLNYVDFNSAFRERGDYRSLAEEAVAKLCTDSRTSWLRPQDVLSEHLGGRVNHGAALRMLVGLALNLEIGGI